MSLWSNIPNQYQDEKSRIIRDKLEDFYRNSVYLNQGLWAEQDIDSRFVAGDQTVWDMMYGSIPAHKRKQFNFNRIRRIVNMVSGYQRRNRKSIIINGVENSDNQTADQYTKILMHIMRQNNGLETISDSFNNALVTGLDLLQVWLDYRNDPVSGTLKIDSCAYNTFVIDPFFKKADLSDCNGIWKRSFLTKLEVENLLPDKKEIISDMTGAQTDGKFNYLPENFGAAFDKNLLTYDEFFYRDYRKQKLLVDSQTGEVLEWSNQDEDSLKRFLSFYPSITVVESFVPTVKVCLLVNGNVIYDDINPLGIDVYPFVPVFGYFDPSLPDFSLRVQGVVRGLRDAQYLYNRRKTIELDMLESSINTGYIFKEGAVVNPKDLFLTGQGKNIAIKDGYQMTDVTKIMPNDIPASMFQLSELLGREIQEISGVNEELLGSALDDKAGILSMLRQGAGLTTLQTLFDQLDRSCTILGRVLLKTIQANFSPGKVKRIIEEEPTAQFYNKAFGIYDAAIEEGFNTTTQKQMEFAQLLQLKELGVNIPDDTLIEAATLQNKTQLIEKIMKNKEQEAQMAQAQYEAQLNLQQMQAKAVDAKSQADLGLSKERESRVLSNIGLMQERRYESVKDLEQAKLNKMQALKTLQEMDITHLQKLIDIVNALKVEDPNKQTMEGSNNANQIQES